MNSGRTLQQQRAAHALAAIELHRSRPDTQQKSYVSYVNALPAMIVMNGLGQAAAMLLARAKGDARKPHRLLYDDLSAWLCGNEALPALPLDGDLVTAIMNGDQGTYLRAQAEALAYCTWLKRFAAAYLKLPDVPGDVE